MKLKLKKFRGLVESAVLIPPHQWTKVGDVQDVPDALGHQLIGDYPDVFEAEGGASPAAKSVEAPANKMAQPAAVKAAEVAKPVEKKAE